MKKTLAAVAVLGAFAGSAMAANVELYGSVSTGLVFTHTDSTDEASSTNSMTMESAWAGDSVFGLTGEEELGNGWKVGFALENEFSSDTGALANDGKLFDSMSYLWVGNDLVKVAAVISAVLCLPAAVTLISSVVLTRWKPPTATAVWGSSLPRMLRMTMPSALK